jgi:flagellar basal-body rod protein FlgF
MDALTITAAGMQDDLKRLEVISQNLANVLTPGYKKQMTIGVPFSAQFSNLQSNNISEAINARRNLIDPSAGSLKFTGRKQDMAIEGDGFFEIKTDEGFAYTRQGSVHVDVQGRLIGEHGFPVMGEAGEMRLNGTAFTIAQNGDVVQDDRIAGRLKRVRFEHAELMTPRGSGMYEQGGASLVEARATNMIRAGYQENSNVNSPQEMIKLTETVRHFEALQKIMQGYDDILEKSIRKLGEF